MKPYGTEKEDRPFKAEERIESIFKKKRK